MPEKSRALRPPGTTRGKFAYWALVSCGGSTAAMMAVQAVRLILYGANYRDEYMALCALLLLLSIVAIVLLRRSIEVGLHFFAWSGAITVGVMSVINTAGIQNDLPWTLNSLLVGVFVLGTVCPGRAANAFTIIYFLFIVIVAARFSHVGNAGALLLMISLTWVTSRIVASWCARLDALEKSVDDFYAGAIEGYPDAVRQNEGAN